MSDVVAPGHRGDGPPLSREVYQIRAAMDESPLRTTGLKTSAKFTAGAHADLDCDNIHSTFERTGTVDSDLRVVGAGSIYISNDIE